MTENTLFTHIQYTSRELMKQLELFNNRFSLLGSSLHYHALLELHAYKKMSMKQLSQLLHVEKHTMSRLVTQLVEKGVCQIQPHANDRRLKLVSLTTEGAEIVNKVQVESHFHIQQALTFIDKKEQSILAQGLSLYTKILKQSFIREGCKVRKLLKKDLTQLRELHAQAEAEFGPHGKHSMALFLNSHHKDISKIFALERSNYFVVEYQGEILGGAGYGPVHELYPELCIIKDFYLTLHARIGAGLCDMFMQKVLQEAKQDGFRWCYSEKSGFMHDKQAFYKKFGFRRSDHVPAHIDHNSTSQWYVKELYSHPCKSLHA